MSHGWVQIANLVLTGLMVVACAVGLRRALVSGPGARWAPRLLAVYGVSLVAAGVFRADPALGFPAGTPEGPGEVSWHGLLHFAAGGIGFTCLAAACFALARRYAADGRRGFARWSRATGVVFLTGFAMVASVRRQRGRDARLHRRRDRRLGLAERRGPRLLPPLTS